MALGHKIDTFEQSLVKLDKSKPLLYNEVFHDQPYAVDILQKITEASCVGLSAVN